jgi:hypothetical protein
MCISVPFQSLVITEPAHESQYKGVKNVPGTFSLYPWKKGTVPFSAPFLALVFV